MTPRELHALSDIHHRSEESLNYRAGLIAAMVANSNRTKDSDHLFQPMDFFEPSKPERELTAEELAENLDRVLRQAEAAYTAQGRVLLNP